MGREVPSGWQSSTLGDHFEMSLGKMLDKAAAQGADHSLYLTNRNVRWDRFKLGNLETMHFTREERELYRLVPGDLLVTEGGEIGRTAMWGGELKDCFFQKSLHRLRARGGIEPRYLLHYMRFAARHGLFAHLSGQTSIAHLTKEKLSGLTVIHPVARGEQRRIVAMLDSVGENERTVEASIAKLRTVRQAVLADALRSGATGWPRRPLTDVVQLPAGQVDPREMPYREQILLAPDHVEPRTGKVIGRESAQSQGAVSGKYIVRPGDVVLSKIRPGLRKVAVADFRGTCSADMYPLSVGDDVLPGFLWAMLLGDEFSSFAESVSGRTGIPKLNRKDLSDYLMCIPPLGEQRRIIAVLDGIIGQEQSIEALGDKLRALKQGLADALLSGKVRIDDVAL
ncbi:restriction endonuclease subunit S [Streptomyces roseofulvus]|uniref:restriction endonuclease subunit S n=1 Tax=Streptomyces roseofulvus TaxID=33902 RepID=UPI0031FC3028